MCDCTNTSIGVYDKSTDTFAKFIIYKECQLDTFNNAGTRGESKLQVHRLFLTHGYMRPLTTWHMQFEIFHCSLLELGGHADSRLSNQVT